jgi:DNA-directed RNA polymerase subunit M/transcription elongation factor TFIIS
MTEKVTEKVTEDPVIKSNAEEEHIRVRARVLFTQIFETNKNDDNVSTEFVNKSVINLEKGIFNWSIQYAKLNNIIQEWSNEYFKIIYTNKLRSLYFNLSKNPQLMTDVFDKKYLAHELAFKTHMELEPEIWTETIQNWNFAKQRELETTVESMTDTFECRKCHSRKTTYYQMQTRSADEPMTVFVSCLECGTRWKC